MPFYDETTLTTPASRDFQLKPTAYQETLIAARADSLAGLIKAKSLTDTQRLIDSLTKPQIQPLIKFLHLKANEADKAVSDTLTSVPKWEVRRKARNAKRRLLIALLCKYEGYEPDALKGARYKLLLNLAKSKGLVTKLER